MVGDFIPKVAFTANTRSERVERSVDGTLNLSEEGDGSADVNGVGGVEYPKGDPLLLGAVDGSELSSAPSPCCLMGVVNIGDSMKGILALERRRVRRITVGWPNVKESLWESRSTSFEFSGFCGSLALVEWLFASSGVHCWTVSPSASGLSLFPASCGSFEDTLAGFWISG